MKNTFTYLLCMILSPIMWGQSSACEEPLKTFKAFASKISTAKDYNAEFTFSRKEGSSEEVTLNYEMHKHGDSWWYKHPTRLTYQGISFSANILSSSGMIILQNSVSGAPNLDFSALDSVLSIPNQVTCSQNELVILPWKENPIKTKVTLENGQIKSFVQEYKQKGGTVIDTTIYDRLSFEDESKVPADLQAYLFPGGTIRKEFRNYELQDLRTK